MPSDTDNLKESSENQLKEIDLLDFIRIIKKRKKIILGLFLIGLITGILWYFLTPSSYQGTIILKIGGIDRIAEATGKKSIEYFENINEIAERLRKGAYGDYPKVEVINPSSTNFIEISIVTEGRDKTITVLEKIKTDILSIHNQKANEKKEAIDQEISSLKNTIESFQRDISYALSQKEQITPLKLEIYKTEKLINDLEKEKTNISMTETIKGPDVTEKRPNYLTIFFAATLGLYIGLTLAFFIDWLGKMEKRL